MGAESHASFTCPDFPSVQLEAEDTKMAEPHVGEWILESHLEESCLREHAQIKKSTLVVLIYEDLGFVEVGSVQFSCSVMSDSVTPWTAACQASLSITNSQSPPKPMSIESVMPSNHLILCRPLLLLPSIFPASGSFQMSQPFTSGGQSLGVSASTSVLPMNTQD